MIERWGSTGSTILTVLSNVFYITPYFLFYAGLGFRYGSYKADLLSTARYDRILRSSGARLFGVSGSSGLWILSCGTSDR